jgi:hypothetical protein
MKVFNLIISILFFSAVFLTSCDKVDPPYGTAVLNPDTTGKSMVLLEEYTGQQCTNCPTATLLAQKFKSLYKGKVVLMSVHATPLADTNAAFKLYLKTDEAENYWTPYYQIGYVPGALINRKAYDGSAFIPTGNWGSVILAEMAKPVRTSIKVTTTYDAVNKAITANASVTFVRKLDGAANICFFVLQDSIMGKQANNNPAIGGSILYPYYFMEVFRGSMNGAYGEQLTPKADSLTNCSYSKTFSIPQNAQVPWIPRNLTILTLITDLSQDPKGVIVGMNATALKIN